MSASIRTLLLNLILTVSVTVLAALPALAQGAAAPPAAPHHHMKRYIILAVVLVLVVYFATRKRTVRPDVEEDPVPSTNDKPV